ncbi:hypothetical protein BHE74_00043057 [Ensete ventricosum]|nr:hypothetical protein BHE74_00043057 [Ensete ventricosum]RZR84831.1 hypothetical protein BHM03_00011714 [Ensete ventricosum]
MAEGLAGGNGQLVKMDSTESRWAARDEEEDSEEEGDDSSRRMSLDSEEEEDNLEQRLIRTGPRIDSFDVEALEVPGAHRNDFEDFSLGRQIVLALQTLGVVFGDVGTSPLYTFDVMLNKYPLVEKEDVLGALSLVLYTLILIPLVKYTLVVLWANDDGEGGTFALYSLICRNAKASLLPNQLRSDARISSFRLKVPSAELERSLKLKEYLENSLTLKKLLLILVLFGTSMVIADGVVTPAMSVMSAFNGLKVGISSVEQDEVVMISIASLIVLFSVQRFGTSKVGLAVGPALFIWFCSLGVIGIYNLLKYGTYVLRAFSPVYIYYFFERNPTQAWMSLGGCLLCATGKYSSLQLTFVFLVLPCLLLGYLGQAAFLVENLTEKQQVFFSSIPMLFLIMYIWNYGSKLKYETEVKQKLSMDLMTELGCNLGTIRAPGIGLNTKKERTGVLVGHLALVPQLAGGVVAVCSTLIQLICVLCFISLVLFAGCRYGYKDVRKEHHQTFEQLLIESLEKYIRREAQERSLESDEDADTDSEKEVSCSNILVAPNGSVYSLGVPLLPGYSSIGKTVSEVGTCFDEPLNEVVADAQRSLERELSFIHKAKESGVVYLLGHGDIRARKESWFIKKLVINYLYAFLRKNCRRGIASLSVPHTNLMQVGMTYMV